MVSLITLICAKSNFKRIIHNQTLPLTFFSSLRAFNSCMAVIFRVSFLDSIMSFLRSILRLLATIPCRPFWLDGSDPPAAPFSFFFFCSSFLACFNFFSISNLFIEMIFTNYSQSHTKKYKINNYDPRRIIYTCTCNSTIYIFFKLHADFPNIFKKHLYRSTIKPFSTIPGFEEVSPLHAVEEFRLPLLLRHVLEALLVLLVPDQVLVIPIVELLIPRIIARVRHLTWNIDRHIA